MEYITLAIHIDNLMRNAPAKPRSRTITTASVLLRRMPASPSLAPSNNEPMQLGFAPLSMEEHQCRRNQHLCFYCGNPGHRNISCPAKNPCSGNMVSKNHSLPYQEACTVDVQVNHEDNIMLFTAMIYSGAALNLIHEEVIKQYNIPTQPCKPPLRITTINNTPEHIHHVKEVLSRLSQHQLYVKAEKCEFHMSKTNLLGYNIRYNIVTE